MSARRPARVLEWGPGVTETPTISEPPAAPLSPPADRCGRPPWPIFVTLPAALFLVFGAEVASAASGAKTRPRPRTATVTAVPPTATPSPTLTVTDSPSATESPTSTAVPPTATVLPTSAPSAGAAGSVGDLGEIAVIAARNTAIPHIILPQDSGGMMQVLSAEVPELACDSCGAWSQPPTVADGEGGFITVRIVHTDFGGGRDELYAQRVSVTGEELWTGHGKLLHTVVCGKERLACIRGVSIGTDGYGGAIVVFSVPGAGHDIVAQRLDHYGTPKWEKPVVSVCSAAGNQFRPLVGSDGKGGAFVAWQDFRKGEGVGDVYVQAIDPAGRPRWPADGVPLYPWMRDQYPVSLRPDGKGGVWGTWYDISGGARYNLWSIHMDDRGRPLTKKPYWWLDQW